MQTTDVCHSYGEESSVLQDVNSLKNLVFKSINPTQMPKYSL